MSSQLLLFNWASAPLLSLLLLTAFLAPHQQLHLLTLADTSSSTPPYSCATPPTSTLTWPTPAFPLSSEFARNPTFLLEWIYMTSSLVTVPRSLSEDTIRIGLQFGEFFETTYTLQTDESSNTSTWIPNQASLSVLALSTPSRFRVDVSAGNGTIVSTNSSESSPTSSGVTAFQLDFASAPTQALQTAVFSLVTGTAGSVFSRYHLQATSPSLQCDLILTSLTPLELHGLNGFTTLSADPCGNTYYFSMPDLLTTGTVRWKEDNSSQWTEHGVEGATWWDHEWGTNVLRESWLRSGIRLGSVDLLIILPRTNNSLTRKYDFDLSLSSIERRDNLQSAFPPLISAPTQSGRLIQVTVNQLWQSSTTQIFYPSTITLTGEIALTSEQVVQYTLDFTPTLDDQEACLSGVCFWEGFCLVNVTTAMPNNTAFLPTTDFVYTYLELVDFGLV